MNVISNEGECIFLCLLCESGRCWNKSLWGEFETILGARSGLDRIREDMIHQDKIILFVLQIKIYLYPFSYC